MKRVGGARRKTRNIMSKKPRNKGKISIRKYFQKLSKGDKVCLKAEPAVQKGVYFRRAHGKTGVVKGTQGACYVITIKDQNKEKQMIVHPVHLQKL